MLAEAFTKILKKHGDSRLFDTYSFFIQIGIQVRITYIIAVLVLASSFLYFIFISSNFT